MRHYSESPRVDVWRERLVQLSIVAVAVTYSFRFVSFLHPKEAVLAASLLALSCLTVLRRNGLVAGADAFLPLWILLGLTAVIHLIVLPARVPSRVAVELTRWAIPSLFVALSFDLMEKERGRARITNAFLLSAVAVAVLGLGQYAGWLPGMFPEFPGYTQRIYSVFGNQDLLGGYVAMAIPLLVRGFLVSEGFSWSSTGGLLACIPALLLSGSRSAWLAAAVGVLLAVSSWRRLPIRRLCFLVVVMGLLAGSVCAVAPEATITRVSQTFARQDQGGRLRLWFWDGTLRMILRHPVLGVGPGNYAYWSPQYMGEALHAPNGKMHLHNELLVEHAHNDVLEIVAETGVLGICFLMWMALRLLRCRGPEWGALVSLVVFSLFNAPAYSAPHALVGLLFAGSLLARRREAQKQTPSAVLARQPRSFSIFLVSCSVALCALAVWTVFLPSYGLRKAEDLHIVGHSPLAAYEGLLRHPWPNAALREKYGIALLEAGRNSESEEQFTRSLEGMDTGQLYLALGVLAWRRGDNDEACRFLDECLYRWPDCLEAWRYRLLATPSVQQEKLLARARQWLSAESLEKLPVSGRG